MPSIAELQKPFNKELTENGQISTTTYRWHDKDYPLLRRQTVQSLCNNIAMHNEKVHYTSILLSGKSGSGKSTVAQTICHRLSCMRNDGKRYIIKWFSGKDLHRMDEIIGSLQKGLMYILIFDDISFVMDQVSSKRKKELANALTTIRHQVEGNVISFMIIHYQRAIMPMMRDSDFRVITSMSDQDSLNWKNTLGWQNRFLIDKFQRQYASQFQKGYFFINDMSDDKTNRYNTDEPFRIALCSEIVGVHPLLVPKEGCQFCAQKKESLKQDIDVEVFWKKFQDTYTTRAKTALQYWAFFTKGKKDAIPTNNLRAINFLNNMLSEYNVDVDKLCQLASKQRQRNNKRIKIDNKLEKKTIFDIVNE